MAINSITFGNVNSADYGIYISGEGVFDAPKRVVETVEVPGRNGKVVIDQGRWDNIDITYPAFNFEPDLETFRTNLANFRNALLSQLGYQRLSDTFHPDEYREAAYIDALEIEPIKYNTASKFNLKFNCKPQRYLLSGEDPVSVSSGDTLTNPTQYESGPLFAIEGYGTLNIGEQVIEIDNAVMGRVRLSTGGFPAQTPVRLPAKYNAGDEVTIEEYTFGFNIILEDTAHYQLRPTTLTTTVSGCTAVITSSDSKQVYGNITMLPETFNTPASPDAYSYTATCTVSGSVRNRTAGTDRPFTVTFSVTYTLRSNRSLYFAKEVTSSIGNTLTPNLTYSGLGPYVAADSSVSILGHPTYIDCDLGEAYKVENDSVIGLNQYIALGSDLPKLSVGDTEITYDNTITGLEVTPRWWKL